MEKWFKWTYVCSMCDALVEYTIKQENIPLDVNMDKYNCVCGGKGILVSYVDATIKPVKEKEEEQTMETATTTYLETQIAELQDIISRQNSALTTHQNCDYWKSENGRVQGQIISLINHSYENESDSEDILSELCQIVDYEPKKEIEFTATMTFTGRIDVPMSDLADFDLSDALSDAYVDINNGDIIIDSYDLEDVEEC